jgi:hypothetical protein
MAKVIPPAAAPDAMTQAIDETSASLAATTRTLTETMTAAGTVIGHRMVLGAQAATDPMNVAHHAEFSLMTSEKVAAFSDAGTAMLDEMQDLNREMFEFVSRQAADTAQAVMDLATAETPAAIFEVQQRFLMDFWTRGSEHALKLATLGSGLSAQVLRPVHSAATANALRLTRAARRPE